MVKVAPEFDWNDRLIRFGVYASAGWIACVVFFLWAFSDWSNKPKPNEWGDIFAGAAAPVAFLWLVLGFLQQGRELKLQIEELRRTVEHQSEIAKATREQFELQARQDKQARADQRRLAQPRFVLTQQSSRAGTDITYELELTNSGAWATNIRVSFDPPHQPPLEHFIASSGPQYHESLTITYPIRPAAVVARILFTDALGQPGRQHFAGTVEGNSLRFVELPDAAETT